MTDDATRSNQLTLREVTALQLVALAVIEAPPDQRRPNTADRTARIELSGASFCDLYTASNKLARALLTLARIPPTAKAKARARQASPARQPPISRAAAKARTPKKRRRTQG